MADWAEKIQNKAGSELFPGEQVVSGILVKPDLKLDGVPYWIPRHGVLATLAARFLSGRSTAEPIAGTAAGFPTSQSVLGISAHRVLAFGHSTIRGTIKKMVSSVGLGDVGAMSVTKNERSPSMSDSDPGSVLLITFRDGSSKSYEVVNSAKLARFVAAFENLHTGPNGVAG